jgi:hypothetical protein
MASTSTNTRSRGKDNNKENAKGKRHGIGDNNKQQQETAEVKRKYEELNDTVESLRGQIASLEKKQLTEDVVKGWLRAALETQATTVTMPIHPGQSTGGYSGLPQLQEDSHCRITLEL